MTLFDPVLVSRLRSFARTRPYNVPISGLSYRRLGSASLNGLEELSIVTLGNTYHSFRHGGATHVFLPRVPFADIKHSGRWQSDESCRRYLDVGKPFILSVLIPPNAESRITDLVSL